MKEVKGKCECKAAFRGKDNVCRTCDLDEIYAPDDTCQKCPKDKEPCPNFSECVCKLGMTADNSTSTGCKLCTAGQVRLLPYNCDDASRVCTTNQTKVEISGLGVTIKVPRTPGVPTLPAYIACVCDEGYTSVRNRIYQGALPCVKCSKYQISKWNGRISICEECSLHQIADRATNTCVCGRRLPDQQAMTPCIRCPPGFQPNKTGTNPDIYSDVCVACNSTTVSPKGVQCDPCPANTFPSVGRVFCDGYFSLPVPFYVLSYVLAALVVSW